jgi:hypothetical protein
MNNPLDLIKLSTSLSNFNASAYLELCKTRNLKKGYYVSKYHDVISIRDLEIDIYRTAYTDYLIIQFNPKQMTYELFISFLKSIFQSFNQVLITQLHLKTDLYGKDPRWVLIHFDPGRLRKCWLIRESTTIDHKGFTKLLIDIAIKPCPTGYYGNHNTRQIVIYDSGVKHPNELTSPTTRIEIRYNCRKFVRTLHFETLKNFLDLLPSINPFYVLKFKSFENFKSLKKPQLKAKADHYRLLCETYGRRQAEQHLRSIFGSKFKQTYGPIIRKLSTIKTNVPNEFDRQRNSWLNSKMTIQEKSALKLARK